jgi:hypothetical protein
MERKNIANPRKVYQRGQALLIVVLVMIIALTVGLSVASRSVVTVQTTTEEENSKRAFSAAEAGIERVLKTGTAINRSTPVMLGNNSQIDSVRITAVAGNTVSLAGGNVIPRDEGIDVWLVPHNASGIPQYNSPVNPANLGIYWGGDSEACSPSVTAAAIEIIAIFGPSSAPTIQRQVYDPCTAQRLGNNFTTATSGTFNIGSKTYKYRTPIGVASGQMDFSNALLFRIVALYTGTPIAVRACNSGGSACTALPGQGNRLDSVGISGNTMRQVSFFQGYPQLPSEFFQYAIFCTTSSGTCK